MYRSLLAASIAALPSAAAAGPIVSGSVDTIAAWNANGPPDHVSFTPGYGVSARRANELSLNLVSLGARLDPEPVGFNLMLSTGSSADFVHSFEVEGSGVGPDVLRFVQQASVAWAPADRLTLEAGIYSSHIGFETFPSQANWNATRSIMGDLSPYYQAGIKAAVRITDSLAAQLHALNGWQVIGDNNDGKILGAQVSWTSRHVGVYLNGLAGPELPGNDDDLRILGDLVVVARPVDALQLAGAFDVATEGRGSADSASWGAVGLWARYAASEQLAFALRGEVFEDADGAISGAAQTLKEVTATVEVAPAAGLLLRLEGRHDLSTARVYQGSEEFETSQTLVLLQAIATFEEALP